MNVSAVLVTYGTTDLEPIIATIPLAWDLVVWDNSKREDLGVYGRYAALAECEHDVVYVQDDDCVLDPAEVVAAYEPGRLVANMPQVFRPRYPDSCLVGFGAVFDRELPEMAFTRLAVSAGCVDGAWFDRTCDVVFTALTPRTLIDVEYRNLPQAYSPERMYRQPGHAKERKRMLALVRQIRAGVAA